MKVVVWLILCAIWGTTWLFIKIGLEDLPPLTFASVRFILALIVLSALMRIGRIPFPRTASEWKLLSVTGVLQFTINYSLVFWSEQHISSGLAAVLQATIPVFGMALAWLYLPQERVTWLKVSALAVGILGVAVIFYDQLELNTLLAFAGSVAIVVGAYAAAHASILTKAKGSGLNPASITFGQMLCGAVPLTALALALEGNPFAHGYSTMAVTSILYLTFAGTIAAFWLYYWLLRRVESTKAMTIALVTPLIAVLAGTVFLGEELQSRTIFGGLMILSSVGLIVFRRKIRAITASESGNAS